MMEKLFSEFLQFCEFRRQAGDANHRTAAYPEHSPHHDADLDGSCSSRSQSESSTSPLSSFLTEKSQDTAVSTENTHLQQAGEAVVLPVRSDDRRQPDDNSYSAEEYLSTVRATSCPAKQIFRVRVLFVKRACLYCWVSQWPSRYHFTMIAWCSMLWRQQRKRLVFGERRLSKNYHPNSCITYTRRYDVVDTQVQLSIL